MASDKMLGSFDQKSAPEDNDLLVEYDASASKVKNVKFGGVWNWIVKKLTSAVINELQTSSKNVVGAINELNSNLPRIEFLTRTITARSEKQVYDLQISVTKYIIISIWSEDRMGWPYTVTRGVSGIEATQNWAIYFIGNPTGNFTFKVAALKIK